jgi:uncharacterized RDD family membrane protein YckC
MKKLNLPKEKTFTGPATVWKRAAAFVVDLLIINLVILFPFRKLFQKIIPETASFTETYNLISQNSGFGTAIAFLTTMVAFLAILYFYILEKKLHQSIGKILFNIYVVSDNKKLKSWQLLARNLFLIPVFPFILLWILDPIFLFFTKNSQRLSEILSKTKVMEDYHM